MKHFDTFSQKVACVVISLLSLFNLAKIKLVDSIVFCEF